MPCLHLLRFRLMHHACWEGHIKRCSSDSHPIQGKMFANVHGSSTLSQTLIIDIDVFCNGQSTVQYADWNRRRIGGSPRWNQNEAPLYSEPSGVNRRLDWRCLAVSHNMLHNSFLLDVPKSLFGAFCHTLHGTKLGPVCQR